MVGRRRPVSIAAIVDGLHLIRAASPSWDTSAPARAALSARIHISMFPPAGAAPDPGR
jgi:hypothetical protein